MTVTDCINGGFNTTLVQLKGEHRSYDGGYYSGWFQYHTGPIKSVRAIIAKDPRWVKSFNTTLVQLKVVIAATSLAAIVCFNTTLVQLKEEYRALTRQEAAVSIPHWSN